jgi:hypothetical protein
MEQLGSEPEVLRADVAKFLDGLVSHYVFDNGNLVVAHAGLKETMHGRIYGPEYLIPANLERLRSQAVEAKRSLANREFALGIEALERFIRKERCGICMSASLEFSHWRASRSIPDFRQSSISLFAWCTK